MSIERSAQPESQSNNFKAAYEAAGQQLAMSVYHVCGDGRVVPRPQDCWNNDRLKLPNLSVGKENQ